MIGIVKLALRRPYAFIVVAIEPRLTCSHDIEFSWK
jgi:hypothetical protein